MEEITWNAPEFIYYEKGPDWYWAVGVISIALAVAAILFGNILFAIVIIAGSFTLSLQASHKPEIVTFTANQNGVQADETLYPYANIDSFWVENSEHEQKLLLKSSKSWMPYIVMPIRNIDPEAVRNFLIKYVPEEEHAEPLLTKVMEYLGF